MTKERRKERIEKVKKKKQHMTKERRKERIEKVKKKKSSI